MRKPKDPKALMDWSNKLLSLDLPTSLATKQLLTTYLKSDDCNVETLAAIICQDPALALKIIRAANIPSKITSYENFITTIPHAISLLGLTTLKMLCYNVLNATDLDSKELAECLSEKSRHSTIAAQHILNFSNYEDEKDRQELYLNTLIYKSAEMMFWAHGGDDAYMLWEQQLSQNKKTPEQVQQEVLGFSLENLGLVLYEKWHLNPKLKDALLGKLPNNDPLYLIPVTHEFAKALDHNDEKAINAYQKEIVKVTQNKQTLEELQKQTKAIQLESKEKRVELGVKELDLNGMVDKYTSEERARLRFNMSEQLMSTMSLIERSLKRELNINDILQSVLQSMRYGVGLDRNLAAIISQDKQSLITKVKLDLGISKYSINEMRFDINGNMQHVLDHMFEQQEAVLFKLKNEEHSLPRPSTFNRLMGRHEYLLGPIIMSDRLIGIVYADKYMTGGKLGNPTQVGFHNFINVMNLLLQNVVVGNEESTEKK